MERTRQRINLSQLKSVMTISASYLVHRSLCFFHKAKIEILFLFFSKPIKRISLVKDSIPPNTLRKKYRNHVLAFIKTIIYKKKKNLLRWLMFKS
ncbi:hypothetical protein NC652_004454 [Populus alba x Populus x berolinensis]|nr:hypothetical protein NC652_004454 [Populus alba x Populus x berolinensis]